MSNHKNDLGRYVITERLGSGYHSRDDDPKAQAFKRHSGMFDLRDTYSGNVICASSCDLKTMRATQARWNSDFLTRWVSI